MSNKKMTLAIIAIILVAAIFFTAEILTDIKPPEHRTQFFPAVEARHITALVVSEGASAIRLEQRGGLWMVDTGAPETPQTAEDGAVAQTPDNALVWNDDFAPSDRWVPADAALVQIAIERLVSLRKSELVSDNPANQANYGVDDASESYVEIYTANPSAPAHVLRIGRSGHDWNSNHVRLMGENGVYLISGGLRQSLFMGGIERWKAPPPPEPIVESDDDGDNSEE